MEFITENGRAASRIGQGTWYLGENAATPTGGGYNESSLFSLHERTANMEFITENGRAASRIGQGTWYLGENAATAARERKALQAGVEAGMNLIDTAEMYGEGASEHLIGSAIRGMDRASLYLVSKVYPFHADRRSIFLSCENSLRRLGTDYLDLYLLHWRGAVPLAETVECMEQLKAKGRIRAWGVSNFDALDMDELMEVTGGSQCATDQPLAETVECMEQLKAKGRIRAWGVSNFDALDMDELMEVTGGSQCATDQVLYHLGSRGVEFDLLPWMQKQGMPMMAYCPLAQAGSLRRDLEGCAAVQNAAAAHGVSPWQVLLSFLLTRPGVYPIPRSSRAEHTLDNAAALELRLSAEELAALDAAFPAPTRRTPLDIV